MNLLLLLIFILYLKKYIYIYNYDIYFVIQILFPGLDGNFLIYIGTCFINILWAYHSMILAKSRIFFFFCMAGVIAQTFFFWFCCYQCYYISYFYLDGLLEIPMA